MLYGPFINLIDDVSALEKSNLPHINCKFLGQLTEEHRGICWLRWISNFMRDEKRHSKIVLTGWPLCRDDPGSDWHSHVYLLLCNIHVILLNILQNNA